MIDHNKNSTKTPLKIIRENIPTTDIAKYYIEIELFKLFKNSSQEMTETIVKTIQELPENKVWGLLEAVSFTYHLNGVFNKVSRENYFWNEEVWKVSDLVLTHMGPKTNKIIFSDEVNGDSIKFKNYLLDYFETTDKTDPEGLFSFKPTNKKIVFDKLLMIEDKGEIRMLDGSHRLIEMLLSDVDEVTAYVGHPTADYSDETQRIRIGNSTFIMLTIMFKRGNPQEKEAIITLVKQLISYSVDGRNAVQKFWIDHQMDEEIVAAGREILKE